MSDTRTEDRGVHADAVEQELEDRVERVTRIAALSMIRHGAPYGDADAVIRRAEYDPITRARLEGAIAGVWSVLGDALRVSDAVAEMFRTSPLGGGATAARANIAAMLGERGVRLKAPRGGDVGDEIAVLGRCDDAMAVLTYIRTAVPRPDRGAVELMAPLDALLESVASAGSVSGKRGMSLPVLHGWVPRAAAAAFVAFAQRSSPSPSTSREAAREARIFSYQLERALDAPNPQFIGGEVVRVSLTGTQARVVQRVLIDVPEVVRPMPARRAFVNAWDQADRSRAAQKGTRFAAPLGVMKWARDMLIFSSVTIEDEDVGIRNAIARISGVIAEAESR